MKYDVVRFINSEGGGYMDEVLENVSLEVALEYIRKNDDKEYPDLYLQPLF